MIFQNEQANQKNIKAANNKNQLINKNNANVVVTWINLPYLGTQGNRYYQLKVELAVV